MCVPEHSIIRQQYGEDLYLKEKKMVLKDENYVLKYNWVVQHPQTDMQQIYGRGAVVGKTLEELRNNFAKNLDERKDSPDLYCNYKLYKSVSDEELACLLNGVEGFDESMLQEKDMDIELNKVMSKYPDIFNLPEFECEVWMGGYAATGEHATAKFLGKIRAHSFREAVEKVCRERNMIDEYLDLDNLTYWACPFYDNEKDARKDFG